MTSSERAGSHCLGQGWLRNFSEEGSRAEELESRVQEKEKAKIMKRGMKMEGREKRRSREWLNKADTGCIVVCSLSTIILYEDERYRRALPTYNSLCMLRNMRYLWNHSCFRIRLQRVSLARRKRLPQFSTGTVPHYLRDNEKCLRRT